MNYAPNCIVSGLYYRVTRRTRNGFPLHTYLPLEMLEMPVNAGDVITKHKAPQGLDPTLALADFSRLVGPAFPEVTRVTVFDGLLLNEQTDSRLAGHFPSFRPVRTLKHAHTLQAQANERLEHHRQRAALYDAFIAGNIEVGHSILDKSGTTLEQAVAEHGFGEGWYIRRQGHDLWSIVTGVIPSCGFVSGYRVGKNRVGQGFHLIRETFHLTLHKHYIRRERPAFGPVVDGEGYRPQFCDEEHKILWKA